MITKTPKGTQDFYGERAELMEYVEQVGKEVATLFGISEIKTPTFEHTELFVRGVGDTTDIVEKEMYTFETKGEKSLTLKPEGTAGAVRAYIQNKLYANPAPTKLFYITSCFRYEKPQAGRFREFHQFGIEYFGSYQPSVDVEVISFADMFLKKLGILNVELQINSLGGTKCREKYNEMAKNFIRENLDELCPICKDRFERNPLRVLDCKEEKCRNILKNTPDIIESLDEECRNHFESVKAGLDELGIKYTVNSKIVRGLDYYTRTVFEFVSTDIGSQGTVCGGGRYDNLIGEFEGPDSGAVGFAIGIERIMMLLENKDKSDFKKRTIDVYIGSMGKQANKFSMSIANKLRENNVSVETDLLDRSVKSQMKYADKIDAKYSTIIGEDEMVNGKVSIKNMETGEKEEVSFAQLPEFFQSVK